MNRGKVVDDVIDMDANASVPPLEVARAALLDALDVRGNSSSPHRLGRRARAVLDEARDSIAAALGADSKEVVLTSGASEGNRFVVDALEGEARRRHQQMRVFASPLEHPSMRRALERAHERRSIELHFATVNNGCIVVDEFLSSADVVVATSAHNETGLLLDNAALMANARGDAVLVVDAAQSVARVAVDMSRADVIVSSAHKVGAFAGAGAFVWRGEARRWPAPWVGGGQEGGLRPGTEALALHAAFGAALRSVAETRAAHKALAPLRDKLEAALVQKWGALALCHSSPRLPNTAALAVPDVDGDALRIALDATGVAVGFGSACSALAPEPSPGLQALGVGARAARATVRLSLPQGMTDDVIDQAIERLANSVDPLRRRRNAPSSP